MTGRGQSPTGYCQTCERYIGTERIFCGPCLAERQRYRNRDYAQNKRKADAEIARALREGRDQT